MSLPMAIADDLTIDAVAGVLRPDHFDLWRDYVSKKDRDTLSSAKVGIVHRFSSGEHMGKAEVDSQDKVYRTFLLLRLVRPTNHRYSNIQIDFNAGVPNVFGFAQPMSPPNTPNLETFNRIHYQHLMEISKLLPAFLSLEGSAPRNFIRAIRMYESGYSDINDPLLQFVAWTIGIESALSGDRNRLTGAEVIARVIERLGADTNIYSDVEYELFPQAPPPIMIKDVLPDIIEARDHVVHGVGVPSRFDEIELRSAATMEKIHYVDVLREAASFTLRRLILRAVEDRDA